MLAVREERTASSSPAIKKKRCGFFEEDERGTKWNGFTNSLTWTTTRFAT